MSTVGVAIPTIPPRRDLLKRAVASVEAQTRPADWVSVAVDEKREGATVTRNRAWRALDTDYVALLDDDDEMLPQHLERLLDLAERTEADMVFPWFQVAGGTDPFPTTHFGTPWDPEHPRQTTITCLWRREALELVGGFPELIAYEDEQGNRVGEDYAAVLALSEAGGRIVHLPERTWTWHHHATNTSGLPSRW